MKKLLVCLLIVSLLFLQGCTKVKTGEKNYQYMYSGIFEDWCRHTTPREGQTDLLEYGEYRYNSELLLFPRETPSTLGEFYMRWSMLMDYDAFAIYFTCELDQQRYNGFVGGLNNFRIDGKHISYKISCNTEDFDYPTYILQWTWHVSGGLFEYVMLDEENLTVIFVYATYESSLDFIAKKAKYNVLPHDMDAVNRGSIYPLYDDYDYDISFLDYLL